MQIFSVAKDENVYIFYAFSFTLDTVNETRIERWCTAHQDVFGEVEYSIEDNTLILTVVEIKQTTVAHKLGGMYLNCDAYKDGLFLYDRVYDMLYNTFGSDVHKKGDTSIAVLYKDLVYDLDEKNKLVGEKA